MISVKAVAVTTPIDLSMIPDAEGLIAFCARVSNPNNQTNFETADKLLGYCARENHWSIFDMANLVLEIKTPRDISRQLIRHSSIKPQEFSQRYAQVNDEMFCTRECRLQDNKNRQNSLESEDGWLNSWWYAEQDKLVAKIQEIYKQALEKGIAKEVARVILPEGLTMSSLYMNGTVRSWIHYINVRKDPTTQKEHRMLAEAVKQEFIKYFPSLESQLV